MRTKTVMWLLTSMVAACADHVETRVAAKANDLGVVSIETERYMDGGDSVFELRGLDARDDQVGLVRLRVGTIADVPGTMPDDDHRGAEIVIAVAGRETRLVTRETNRFELGSLVAEQPFLAIVATTLQQDANIIVEPARPAGEIALSANACPTNQILTSPEAFQCCYDGGTTTFANGRSDGGSPTATTRIIRGRNPYGTGCKASDGQSPCSGAACYYGPLGYSKPMKTTPGVSGQWWITGGSSCSSVFLTYIQSAQFGDEWGTAPTGQGCPGGNTGAYSWDY